MGTRILILGGGFAGVSAARSLVAQFRDEDRLRHPYPSQRPGGRRRGADDSVEVVLVSRDSYFVFQPLLADVLPGTIQPTHSVLPLRRMLRGVDVEVAVVEEIDPTQRRILMRRRQDGSRFHLSYDHLVIALGSVADFGTVPGIGVPHPRTGVPAPATAQHAVRQGPHLAANIMRAMAGQTLEPYHYHSKGMLVSLGTLRGAGSVLGLQVSGWSAWFLWRGNYLAQLPTLDRRFRVALDWLADLFLPRDIVQIDLRRSKTRPDPDGVVAETLGLPVEGGP